MAGQMLGHKTSRSPEGVARSNEDVVSIPQDRASLFSGFFLDNVKRLHEESEANSKAKSQRYTRCGLSKFGPYKP